MYQDFTTYSFNKLVSLIIRILSFNKIFTLTLLKQDEICAFRKGLVRAGISCKSNPFIANGAAAWLSLHLDRIRDPMVRGVNGLKGMITS